MNVLEPDQRVKSLAAWKIDSLQKRKANRANICPLQETNFLFVSAHLNGWGVAVVI